MSAARALRPALFLDRDGVLNEEVGYLYRPEDFILMEGATSLVRTANQLGYVTCVITNQSGIGRGLYTEKDFHVLMKYVQNVFAEESAFLDAVYFSPFHPLHGLGRYKRQTDCRKPGPGMLVRAAAEHGVDLSRSILVGDRCSDLEAGAAAGVQRLFLFGTTERGSCPVNFPYREVRKLCSVEEELNATSLQCKG